MLSISPFLVIDDNNLEYVKEGEVFKWLGLHELETIRSKGIRQVHARQVNTYGTQKI
jgi:hypothetical protein